MKRVIVSITLLLLAGAGSVSADKAAASNRKGIDAYRNKRYEESLKQFTEALIERPKTPELRFNRGTALSAMGKKDEAVSELDAAARSFKTKEHSAAAQYNAGNASFAAGDFRGALGQYKTAVKLDQQSRDIRYNLELAVRKMTEQKKEQSDKDTKNKDEKKNDEKKNKTPQNKQQQKMEQQQSRQQNSDVQPMTKEEAERLLDAMNDDEKKSLSLRNQQMKTKMRAGDDW
jgi:tetratricopeptide (TPR) repeat protein